MTVFIQVCRWVITLGIGGLGPMMVGLCAAAKGTKIDNGRGVTKEKRIW